MSQLWLRWHWRQGVSSLSSHHNNIVTHSGIREYSGIKTTCLISVSGFSTFTPFENIPFNNTLQWDLCSFIKHSYKRSSTVQLKQYSVCKIHISIDDIRIGIGNPSNAFSIYPFPSLLKDRVKKDLTSN